MRSLFYFLILTLTFSVIYGWTALEQTDNSKDHPGYCYSETKGVGAMEKGEVKKQPGECVRVACGEGGLISYSGCGVIAGPEGCKKVQDLSQPYPDCCHKLKC